ncbi:GGDEF domain-containing protein [Streptomyces sp. ICBB 8177]|uniref:GGDEF domain-containing protein n=1 Tax=Streptomyces sp. ICBB 8177 TaxID=563922 RepID=UPI0018EE7075|nr:GGDEF domain-containing protein [Streptomyces sp. ICBB 8177]
MSQTLTGLAAALPLSAGWSVHTLWMRHRIAQARRDPLTGLPARAMFERRAVRLLRRGPVAAVVIDLDGFKGVNDTFGHAAGDAAIRETGVRLAEWAEPLGIVARLGGDEFAALLSLADWDLNGELAALHEWLCHPFGYEGRALRLGASIGAACTVATRPGEWSALLRRADEAMYEAKRNGGGWLLTDAPVPVMPSVNGRRAGRTGGAR